MIHAIDKLGLHLSHLKGSMGFKTALISLSVIWYIILFIISML